MANVGVQLTFWGEVIAKVDILRSIAEAIFQFESGGKANTLAVINNNPGNLVFIGQPGAVAAPVKGADGITRTYAKFPTWEAGWQALENDLQYKINRGMTLNQLISVWAPPSDNNPTSAYAAFVAKKTGLDPNTPLISFFGQAAAAAVPTAAAFLPSLANLQAIPDELAAAADLARSTVASIPDWVKWSLAAGGAALLVYLFVE